MLYIDPTRAQRLSAIIAHKIENSYEPSCVVVCPVEAIISGDLDDPNSSISNYVSEHEVTVRKPESGASPTYSMSKLVRTFLILTPLNALGNIFD